MRLRVRLFAALRERAGSGEFELELPDGASVADALARLQPLTRDVPVVLAVNREFAPPDTHLRSGDELALIPPVSGGSAIHVRVSAEPLDVGSLLERVRDPRAGAVVSFTGITRNVAALEYEAYAEMATLEIEKILRAAIDRHGLCAAAAEHRFGTVPLTEASVAIAVSAPHRDAAFHAAREIIDRIKAQAPIWKREEGSWIAGALPSS